MPCLFPQEAGELYNRMLKRFRQEKAVWIKYGAFLLRRSQAGASHRVLQRALECLPSKERECSFPAPKPTSTPRSGSRDWPRHCLF